MELTIISHSHVTYGFVIWAVLDVFFLSRSWFLAQCMLGLLVHCRLYDFASFYEFIWYFHDISVFLSKMWRRLGTSPPNHGFHQSLHDFARFCQVSMLSRMSCLCFMCKRAFLWCWDMRKYRGTITNEMSPDTGKHARKQLHSFLGSQNCCFAGKVSDGRSKSLCPTKLKKGIIWHPIGLL